eukprot:CAMPEP_0182441860 /NCGR_PEP_ID=MMETSP1172-20130603/862_1 /TAXON_ID=708627 /ORGANISM="Timspurckia oligopyrenoides, Strain CCMP3278" /LENGTH=420 /DNA_ID=CAMNT_0024636443 /DNA_START=64 /DNA_END=1326 /DNA_ORIENTATION=+
MNDSTVAEEASTPNLMEVTSNVPPEGIGSDPTGDVAAVASTAEAPKGVHEEDDVNGKGEIDGIANVQSSSPNARKNFIVETKTEHRFKLLGPILLCVLGWLLAAGFLGGMIYEVARNRSRFYDPEGQNLTAWSYIGATNPPSWGNLSDAMFCGTGALQSPIALDRSRRDGSIQTPDDNMQRGSLNSVLTFENEVTVSANFQDNSYFFFCSPRCGTVYVPEVEDQVDIDRFVFRTRSEHSFDGTYADIELQYMSSSEFASSSTSYNGSIVSVFILASESDTNSTENVNFALLLDLIQEVGPTTQTVDVSVFVRNMELGYYAYNGSLSYPPCTEGYRIMFSKSLSFVSSELVRQFKNTMSFPGNFRNLQAQSGRPIFNYEPNPPTETPSATPESLVDTGIEPPSVVNIARRLVEQNVVRDEL